MELGSWAEWFAAIGSVGAVIVALFVATRESRLRRKENTRKQADSISAWPIYFGLLHSKKLVIISNNTQLPIYDVLVSFGVAYGAGQGYSEGDDYQSMILRVPPGEYFVKSPKDYGGGMHTQLGVAISFRDVNGKFWLRDATGVLTELFIPPFDFMKVSQPISSWEHLDPVTPIYKP